MNIVETGIFDTLNTQIHDRELTWQKQAYLILLTHKYMTANLPGRNRHI